MRIVAYRGETSVRAIADKHFADLPAKDRRKAAKALLDANPQLHDLERVAPATLIRVPSVPRVDGRALRGLDDPAGAVLDQVGESLAEYGERLTERHEGYKVQLKGEASLLKDRAVKKVIDSSEALKKLADAASKANGEQGKLLTDRQKRIDKALEQLKEDLGAL